MKSVVDASGDGIATAGEELTYTITIMNPGPGAQTVDVTDKPDTNIVHVDGDSVQLGSTNVVITGADLNETTFGELISGIKLTIAEGDTATLVYVVKVVDPIPDGVENISNIVTVIDETGKPKEPETTIPTINPVTANKVVVDETLDGIATSGEKLTYTIAVNNPNDVAQKVNVKDTPDENVVYDETTVITIRGANLTESTMGVLSTVLGGAGIDVVIPANSTATFTYTVMVKDPIDVNVSIINNIALVTDETGKTHKPETEIPTRNRPRAASVTKSVKDESGDGIASAGEMLTYTVTVTNPGLADQYVDIYDTPDVNVLYDAQDLVLVEHSDIQTTTLGEFTTPPGIKVLVPASDTVIFTYQVKVVSPLPEGVEKIDNVVVVIDETGEEHVRETTIPTPKPVTATKSIVDADGDGKATQGEKLTYTITITNPGPGSQTVKVVDTPDSNVVFKGTDIVNIMNADKANVTMDDLITGFDIVIDEAETAKIEYIVTVKDPLPKTVEEIKNIVTVTDETDVPKKPEVTIPVCPDCNLPETGSTSFELLGVLGLAMLLLLRRRLRGGFDEK